MSFSDCYYIKAEEFCVKVTDGTHDSPKRKTEGKFLITSKHIKSREIDFESAYLIDGIDFDKINQRSQVNQWDVLISMIGEYCGFVYVERNFEIDYAVKNVGIFKTGEKEKAEWIYYYLSSPEGKNKLNTLRSGTSQPYISLGALRKLPILQFKNKNIMTGIIKILTKIDEKIHINYQINKTLENMAQAIFTRWFVDFEFPNEDGEPYKSSGGGMVESELGMIPKGWEVKSLCDIARIDTKSIKPFENGDVLYEHYSIPALDANNYPNFEYGREIKSNKYKVFEDSILISKLNPSTKRIWLPLYLSNRAICSTEFLNYRPRDTKIKAFVYSIIDSTRFTEFLMNHVTGSTGSRQRVKPQDTLSYKFAMPNSDMLKEFCEVIDGIYTKKNNNLNENQNMKAIRDSLLPKLMSGEIRVPLNEEGDAS